MALRNYFQFLTFQKMSDVFTVTDMWLTFCLTWLSLCSILFQTVFILPYFWGMGRLGKEWKPKWCGLWGVSVIPMKSTKPRTDAYECTSPPAPSLALGTEYPLIPGEAAGEVGSSLALRSWGAPFSPAIHSLSNFGQIVWPLETFYPHL